MESEMDLGYQELGSMTCKAQSARNISRTLKEPLSPTCPTFVLSTLHRQTSSEPFRL